MADQEGGSGPTSEIAVTRRAIDASNALTVRWVRSMSRPAFVVSGASVWPLLAALAAGADGPARAELERAVGIPAGEALAEAAGLFATLDRIDGGWAALGIWLHDTVVLDRAWSSSLPSRALGRLSGDPARDGAALDDWARARTRGVLNGFKVPVSTGTLLLIAAAYVVRTRWETRFADRPLEPESGPWAGHLLDSLFASVEDVDLVSVADTTLGALTMFVVRGVDDVDVHLVAGPADAPPGAVLAEAIAASSGARPQRRGADLRDGETAPGLVVTTVQSPSEDAARVEVTTVRFDVTGRYDLAEHADLFGMGAARDRTRGHFPGISATLLAIEEAGHVARASFSAEGFEAAAVSWMGLWVGALDPPPNMFEVHVIKVTFDRPFGFLAIDRTTGLVLFAGWVDFPAGGDQDPQNHWFARALRESALRRTQAAGGGGSADG